MKDSNAPKRSASAYFLFCAAKRPEVVASVGSVLAKDVAPVFGKLWSEATEGEKQPYIRKADEGKARYAREMELYKQTPEYAEFQKQNKANKLIHKYAVQLGITKKSHKSFPRDPNAPKKATTAYMLFADSIRPGLMRQHAGSPMSVVGKLIGERWASADSATKQKFEHMAVHEKTRYEAAVAKYQQSAQYQSYMNIRGQYDAERKSMNSKQSIKK